MSRRRSSPEDLDRIDDCVRRAYEAIVNEELPDRFSDLLEKLRKGEEVEEKAPSEERS